MWRGEHGIEVSASPERVWSILCDVDAWKAWNAGIEKIAIHGPFATGTNFTMKPPGEDEFVSTLVDVDPFRGFTDETVLGDTKVVVAHTIVRLGPDRVRIVYATEVTGPDAEAIGRAVTADFPDVLAALKARAETA